MSGHRFISESGSEVVGDERLSAVLRQWEGVEPQADFDDVVWRRIRAAPVAHPARLWDQWRDGLLPHPVWTGAVAAAAALVIGLLAGMATPGNARSGGHEAHALLHPRTLMGACAALSESGRP